MASTADAQHRALKTVDVLGPVQFGYYRRSAATAGSATLTADVGSWTQTCEVVVTQLKAFHITVSVSGLQFRLPTWFSW